MKSDGNLRSLFKSHLPGVDFQPIESGLTGRGIPDTNYCTNGAEGWIENKVTSTRRVVIRSEQVAWAERRMRFGGRVFLAVRMKSTSGPRKGPPKDELYFFSGESIRSVYVNGLRTNSFLVHSVGGPAQWDWAEIRKKLIA